LVSIRWLWSSLNKSVGVGRQVSLVGPTNCVAPGVSSACGGDHWAFTEVSAKVAAHAFGVISVFAKTKKKKKLVSAIQLMHVLKT